MERIHLILSVLLLCNFATAQANITTDQSALLALKPQITDDPRNILTTNWSTTASNVCNWVGVTCGAGHPSRVTALNLSYMGLTGTIPPSLGNLSFLLNLDLRNNSFHGTLPQELASLRRLKLISLRYNSFLGPIPSWCGSLSNLQTFDLYGNQFSGLVPSAIFNSSALQVINLSYNQLSGSIPREIGNSTMLKEIYLDVNNFKEIPDEIGSLDLLEMLFVQGNALKGHVPAGLFNKSSLIALTLYWNNLNGGIPDNICEHLPSIMHLNLGRNQFDGPLPSKLWQCIELVRLALVDNKFSGSIPKSIGNLTHIRELDLGSNNLIGNIPDEIGDLQNLQVLSLGINNLIGSIPSRIFNMSMIRSISFTANQLSGSLPTDIGVPYLQVLQLGDNELSGAFPNSISNASMLTDLEIGKNSFTGFIPSSLCALTNLTFLSLYRNTLTIDTSNPKTNILSCLANLRNLRKMFIGDNPLNATLPVSFGDLSASMIDVSNANLRGSIPNEIGNLSSLIALGLSDNQFTGSIPPSIGRLQTLQVLYLSDNNLEGDIPSELCRLDNLAELYLQGNHLSGSVPSCLSNLAPTLRIISLSSNLLTSTIPSTLWRIADILYLNLSSNLLNGSLSEDIGKLKAVTVLDLSNNHFSGGIPSGMGGLKTLINISLENNHFEGLIPSSFGELLSLEFLDLSQNNLSGAIPKSFKALAHLNYLNVSFNTFQGEVPTGGPFHKFSGESYVSNGELCGESRLHLPPCKITRLEPNSRKSGIYLLKYIIPAVVSVILLIASLSIFIMHKKRKVEVATNSTSLHQVPWRRVSQLELRRATNAFNEINLLGSGGFGSVYRGTLSDGMNVAIKVFNLQLEGASKSFDTECQVLSSIRHRNLVKIISCVSEIDFKALVLQYMPNGSLEKWLYSQNSTLNLLQRLNIMTDVALALEYLHYGHDYSEHVVHCDLKPNNLLLDDDMVGHVADFGIAKLFGGGDSMSQTMTLATIGYMAPEYGREGIVSKRGDVYSFGILLMETFTRRKPTDEMFGGEMDIKQWIANSLLSDDALAEVVDVDLLGTEEDDDFVINRDCLSSIMRLALACSAESPQGRINMQDAVVALNKIKRNNFSKDRC